MFRLSCVWTHAAVNRYCNVTHSYRSHKHNYHCDCLCESPLRNCSLYVSYRFAFSLCSKFKINSLKVSLFLKKKGVGLIKFVLFVSFASLPLDYQWLVLGCARFAKILSELTKTWSSGATECRVWMGNCVALKFCKISGKRTHPRNTHYESFPTLILYWAVLGSARFAEILQNYVARQVFTSRKRSLGQGNIFTPVCHSVQGGRAWLLRGACMVLFGGLHGFIPGAGVVFPGACMVFLGGGACVVFSVFSDTLRYSQWAGGTHPTGMHSCWDNVLDNFICIYIETADSNFTSSCTYTLSFLACHNFSKTSTPLTPQLRWQFYHWHMLACTFCTRANLQCTEQLKRIIWYL